MTRRSLSRSAAPGREEPLTVEWITDPQAFAGLSGAWDELLAASPSDCFFLTWEWLFTWWKHLGRGRLAILAARRGGRLLALLPAYLPAARPRLGLRPLRFLGTGCVGSDYLDVIARDGEERAALAALAERLDGDRRLLELAQVPQARSAAADLAGHLAGRGWRPIHRVTHVCPYVELGRSWEDYLAGLGTSHRGNVRRQLRKLEERFEVSFARVETGEELDEAFDLLVALHRLRWKERGGSDAFPDPGVVAFHREVTRLALARGWLRLFVLRLSGRPAAALYGLLYRGRFLFYQSGFDPAFAEHSVGQLTVGLTIRAAIEEGAREYDLLHGIEPYKFHWANRTRELVRIELFPASLAGLLARQLRGAEEAAKGRLSQWLRPRAAAAPVPRALPR